MGLYKGSTAITGVYKGSNALTGVYSGSTKVRPTVINFATQGPCPDGFHVPLKTERENVYTIWIALGGTYAGGGFGINLKIPGAGRRRASDGNLENQPQSGFLRTATAAGNSSGYEMMCNTRGVHVSTLSKGYGIPIRPFKNEPVTPQSSWTKLYGTSIAAGGIFWSSSKGLISLSSDGTTWVTIADKNLGATSVYSDGATLSEANCGKCFQWGNNYGFPRDGSMTTSSTRVDASTYGPGNYYSSSTFITYDDGSWDTTINNNLRGGEDGNVPV